MYGSEFAVVSRQGAAPSKRAVCGVALMLRVPLWAGPSHVMKLGPIGIADDLDQPEPPRHDHIQALAKAARVALDALERGFHMRLDASARLCAANRLGDRSADQ